MDERAQRIEEIEALAFSDLGEAAKGLMPLNLKQRIVNGALVSVASGDPHFLINRVIGLGVREPATRGTISLFKDVFAASEIGRYFVHLHCDSQPAELKAWLQEDGHVAHRRWMTFVHGGSVPESSGSDLEVRQIGPEHGEDFGKIVAASFDFGDATVPALALLTDRPKWSIFMGFADGEPAAAGALFVDKGVGWCDLGATSAKFRKRGGQRAMLKARVEKALGLGCDLIATETGESVEGDAQHSYHNIQWAGFEEAYLRDNFVPA
jgi:GNAT superfamily N-acetyltransferase